MYGPRRDPLVIPIPRLTVGPFDYWQLLLFAYPLGAYLGWIGATAMGKVGFATLPYQSAGGYGLLAASCALYLLRRLSTGAALPVVWYARQAYQRWSLALLGLALTSLVVGLYRDWPMVYVVGDLLYPVLGVVTYALLRIGFAGAEITPDSLLTRIIHAARVLGVVASVLFLVAHAPIPAALTTLFLAVTFVSLYVKDKPWGILFTVLPLALQIPQLNRATLLQFALVLLIGAFTMTFRARWLAWLAVLALVAAPFLTQVDWQHSLLLQRLNGLQGLVTSGEGGTAIEQRLYEQEAVQAAYETAGPLTWALGFGSGATLDMSGSSDASVQNAALLGAEDVHNIHLLPVAMLYRFGLAGVLLVLGFALVTLARLVGVLRTPVRDASYYLRLMAVTYLLASLIAGFFATNQWFANPFVFGFMALMDAVLLRNPRPTPSRQVM